jgi:hypothetical protein
MTFIVQNLSPHIQVASDSFVSAIGHLFYFEIPDRKPETVLFEVLYGQGRTFRSVCGGVGCDLRWALI